MDCIIRPAEAADSPQIMRMIRELAEYEKITHLIKLTEEALLQDGFGTTPWFHCLVAELPERERSESGRPFAGYALFAHSYSSWTGRTLHLEDLYVCPQFRGRSEVRLLSDPPFRAEVEQSGHRPLSLPGGGESDRRARLPSHELPGGGAEELGQGGASMMDIRG
ncbi:thialysine N-epsilon-acetyltransferase-like isoform X2 [Ranitomeya variabilis]|uniref:thialysine N-epsilon-acetyltransferase-like isoform X2 n=1 Tax=Ranitomeya variabilis TaxID=490064 RepID=UPI0040568640